MVIMITKAIKVYLDCEAAIKNKEQLSGETLNYIGYFDKANRFDLYNEYETESSQKIRTPSRAWPFSKLKHTSTQKYKKQLLKLLFLNYERDLIAANTKTDLIKKVSKL